MTALSARATVSLLVCGFLSAQQPGAAPPAPSVPAKGDELRRAFVDADGGRRIAINAAADRVLQSGAEGRANFMALLRAVVAVAPAPVPAPATTPATPGGATGATPPAAGGASVPGGTPPAEARPVEFADATKALMAAAVAGPMAETTSALAKLAADKESGAAALTRLLERGRAIHARCLAATLRRKMETNALFAGQYAEFADFKPEAIDVLLGWVKDPPRDATQPDNFRAACVRALRDIVPAGEANEALLNGLKAGMAKAQQSNSEDLAITLVCALHQFGETKPFDGIKAAVEKQAESADEQQKAGAISMLANLHYQLRRYEEAASYYTSLIALLEKQPQSPPGLPTMIYNAACSMSLAGKLDDAFATLEKALQASQKDKGLSKAMLDADHDMNNLRADPRFGKLMEQYFGARKDAPK